MGKTETNNNHFISKYIMRKFKPKGCNLYELDCVTKKIVPKSIDNLFSGERLWGQGLEDTIDRDFENQMARAVSNIQNVINWRNDFTYLLEVVTDEKKCKLYNTFIMQSALFQRSTGDDMPDYLLEDAFKNKMSRLFPVIHVRIHPLVSKDCPLLLVDSMVFMDIVLDDTKKTLGNAVFSYPISPSEMIILGTPEQSDKFLTKFSHPHFINVCAILHQNKKCKVASSNERYLIQIKDNLDSFGFSDKAPYQIGASR